MLGILFVCIIVVSAALVLFPIAASSYLEWGVDVGDSFSYHIAVDGWDLNYTGSYHQQIPSHLMRYDGLSIIAEVVDLPVLGLYLSGNDFKQVITHQKVQVVFENGTDTPTELSDITERIISNCFLPIGGWYLIDWFYPDTATSFPYPPTYTTSSDTSFHLGYDSLDIDLTTRLRSDISFEEGVPTRISYYRSHGVDYAFNVTLTQIVN